MRPLTEKARSVIEQISRAFDSTEKLVDSISHATLIPNTSPCAKWGPYNRFIVAMRGTSDARGFRQWQDVGRTVKKGGRAVLILVPRFKKIEKNADQEEETDVLIGFVAAPVFAVEDTEGEPLPELAPKKIPRLQAVADFLGIPVRYAGAVSERVLGVYTHERGDRAGDTGRITLYSQGLDVFYHELAHALHHRAGKKRPSNDKADKRDNEIVAEISAAVLVNVFEGQEMGHQAISYVKGYEAHKTHLLKLLPEIMEVVDLAITFSSAAIIEGQGRGALATVAGDQASPAPEG